MNKVRSIRVLVILIFSIFIPIFANPAQLTFSKEFPSNPTSWMIALPKEGYVASLQGSSFPTMATLDVAGNIVTAFEYRLHGNVQASFDHLINTHDGGYAAIGQFSKVGHTKYESIIAKFDSGGLPQWLNVLSGGQFNGLLAIEQTPDGDYIGVGAMSLSFSSGNEAWIVKFSSKGQVKWSRIFTTSDAFRAVEVTADGGFLVTGIVASSGYSGAVVMKLSSRGQVQWARTYFSARPASLRLFSMAVTPTSGAVLAGDIDEDAFLMRIGSRGGVIWTKAFDARPQSLVFSSVIRTKDHGYLAAGDSFPAQRGDNHGLLLKVNSLGKLSWARSAIEGLDSLYQTSDSGFSLTVSRLGLEEFDLILKTNTAGLIPGCSLIKKFSVKVTSPTIRLTPSKNLRLKSVPTQATPLACTPQEVSIDSKEYCQ